MADENGSTEAETGLGQTRISRRTLVKGGAVVAGTAWVAPAIESFIYKAAAVSGTPRNGCQPDGAYGLSGLTIVYTRSGTLYWTFIGQNETSCDSGGGSISNDDSFMTMCGGKVLAVNMMGNKLSYGGQIPINDPAGCYFTASAGGATLTSTGVTAGVQVVAWIAHNGTFVGGTPLGSKKHFEVQCAGSGATCPNPAFQGGG